MNGVGKESGEVGQGNEGKKGRKEDGVGLRY
jgi:hypothetical protein